MYTVNMYMYLFTALSDGGGRGWWIPLQ